MGESELVATIIFNADIKNIVQFVPDTPSYGIITIMRDSSPITEKIFFNRSTSRILQTDQSLLPIHFPMSVHIPCGYVLSSPFYARYN